MEAGRGGGEEGAGGSPVRSSSTRRTITRQRARRSASRCGAPELRARQLREGGRRQRCAQRVSRVCNKSPRILYARYHSRTRRDEKKRGGACRYLDDYFTIRRERTRLSSTHPSSREAEPSPRESLLRHRVRRDDEIRVGVFATPLELLASLGLVVLALELVELAREALNLHLRVIRLAAVQVELGRHRLELPVLLAQVLLVYRELLGELRARLPRQNFLELAVQTLLLRDEAFFSAVSSVLATRRRCSVWIFWIISNAAGSLPSSARQRCTLRGSLAPPKAPSPWCVLAEARAPNGAPRAFSASTSPNDDFKTRSVRRRSAFSFTFKRAAREPFAVLELPFVQDALLDLDLLVAARARRCGARRAASRARPCRRTTMSCSFLVHRRRLGDDALEAAYLGFFVAAARSASAVGQVRLSRARTADPLSPSLPSCAHARRARCPSRRSPP